jgi:hypothetical protein
MYQYGPSTLDSKVRLLDKVEKTFELVMAGDIMVATLTMKSTR